MRSMAVMTGIMATGITAPGTPCDAPEKGGATRHLSLFGVMRKRTEYGEASEENLGGTVGFAACNHRRWSDIQSRYSQWCLGSSHARAAITRRAIDRRCYSSHS